MRRLLIGLALFGSLTWGFQDITIDGTADEFFKRMTSPLTRAGIPVNDEASLIRALNQRDNLSVAVSAAYALRKLPRSDWAIRELNAAVLDEHDTLMAYAIESLIAFGDLQWVNTARVRLPNIEHDFLRLAVAGYLASAGVYDGWPMMERAITGANAETRFYVLGWVDRYRQMKDPAGKPVDVVKRLDELRTAASDAAVKADILRAIDRLTMPGPLPPNQSRKRPPAK